MQKNTLWCANFMKLPEDDEMGDSVINTGGFKMPVPRGYCQRKISKLQLLKSNHSEFGLNVQIYMKLSAGCMPGTVTTG